ncbi:LpxL/LpxP family acyltransferase [Methylomonas sp. MgM2]
MTAETTPGHWAALEERSLVWGIRVLVWIYRIFGRWAFRLILGPVVSYYFLTGRVAREASLDYLHRLAGYCPELNLKVGWWLSYRHFLSFGETLLDKIIAWMGCIDPNQVDFPNRPVLLKLIEQKRGAMILSGHIGNLELCQAIADMRGLIRLNILVHTRHAEKFNRLLGRGAEGSATIKLIQVTELNPAMAVELQEKIDHGEFLVMVGDRVPVQGGRTVKAKFLGEGADFPQGPYLLASMLQCPVFTLFCYPTRGRYQVHLESFSGPFRIPRSEPRRTQMLSLMAQCYAVTLEQHCRAEPLQWFNFYPYWPHSNPAVES